MQEIYSDERIGGTLPEFRFKKGKAETDMSKPGTTKYETDRISFFLSVSVPLSSSLPHTDRAEPRADSKITGTVPLCVPVCLCEGKREVTGRETRDGGMEEDESSQYIPRVAEISQAHISNTLLRV